MHELLKRGADVEARNERGETALHMATFLPCLTEPIRTEVAGKSLPHQVDVAATDVWLKTFLRECMMDYIINTSDESFDGSMNVDASIERSNTSLHSVARFGLGNHNENTIEVVRQLLRYKANVNAKDRSSFTPLHYAASSSCGECVDVLLAAGARVNELDIVGRTALHLAVYNDDEGQIIARKLILAGTDLNITDNGGMTALDTAQTGERSDVFEVIAGAQVQLRQQQRRERRSHRTSQSPEVYPTTEPKQQVSTSSHLL